MKTIQSYLVEGYNLGNSTNPKKESKFADPKNFAKNVNKHLWARYDKKILKYPKREELIADIISQLKSLKGKQSQDIYKGLQKLYSTSTNAMANLNGYDAFSGKIMSYIVYACTNENRDNVDSFQSDCWIDEHTSIVLDELIKISENYEKYIKESANIRQKYIDNI